MNARVSVSEPARGAERVLGLYGPRRERSKVTVRVDWERLSRPKAKSGRVPGCARNLQRAAPMSFSD